MSSPYLERPLRLRHVVIADIIANTRETCVVIDLSTRGEPYLREADLGQSFGDVLRDLLAGEYDTPSGDAPWAVIRISRDGPVEDITDKIADAMIDYLRTHPEEAYDDEGYLRPRPFLDNVRPGWTYALPQGSGRIDREDDAA